MARTAASNGYLLDERFQAESSGRVDGLRDIHARLNDPFEIEEVALEFERHVRNRIVGAPLNRNKTVFQAGSGEDWEDLFSRLMRLDASSQPAVVPLHRLFDAPERLDEIVRHLATIEADEDRQRELYGPVHNDSRDTATPCPTWGVFLARGTSTPRTVAGISRHQRGVRLSAVQLIQPFDADLATEFERDVSHPGR